MVAQEAEAEAQEAEAGAQEAKGGAKVWLRSFREARFLQNPYKVLTRFLQGAKGGAFVWLRSSREEFREECLYECTPL